MSNVHALAIIYISAANPQTKTLQGETGSTLISPFAGMKSAYSYRRRRRGDTADRFDSLCHADKGISVR